MKQLEGVVCDSGKRHGTNLQHSERTVRETHFHFKLTGPPSKTSVEDAGKARAADSETTQIGGERMLVDGRRAAELEMSAAVLDLDRSWTLRLHCREGKGAAIRKHRAILKAGGRIHNFDQSLTHINAEVPVARRLYSGSRRLARNIYWECKT